MQSTCGNTESLDCGNAHQRSWCVADVSDESIFKIMYLALRNAARKWTSPTQDGSVTFFA
jgi:hypothetical protein